MNDPRLLGVVLCGGKSSRMGVDKAGLPHPAGGSFLEFAVRRADSVCDSVCVSGDCQSNHPFEVIADFAAHQGPVVGIAASLQVADQRGYEACLVTPVDTPLLAVENLVDLVDDWTATRELTIAKTLSPQPLIGIYPTTLAGPLRQLAHSDDRSLMHWLEGQHHRCVALPEQVCRNINTPEDFSDVS